MLVLKQEQNKIVNKVETVADDYQRQLLSEFGFLEEVFDLLWIICVAFRNSQ
jgi:hypothetical protein